MFTRRIKSIFFAIFFAVCLPGGAAFAEDNITVEPADPNLVFGPRVFFEEPVRFVFGDRITVMTFSTFLGKNGEYDFTNIYNAVPFINRYALDAKVYMDEGGNLAVSEEKSGMRIDLEKLESDVKKAVENHDLGKIEVEFAYIPPKVTKTDLESVLPKLKEIISNKVILTTEAGGGTTIAEKYTFNMREHFDALDVKFTAHLNWNGMLVPVSLITQDPLAVTILKKDWVLGLNTQKIDEYIKSELAAEIEVPAQNVTIIVEEPEVKESEDWIYNAKITFEGTAQNGLIVERSELIANMLQALNGKDKVAIIPLKEVEALVFAPQVLIDRGIKELFSVGYSNFRGSTWKRVHNINVGIARFNGVLIPKNSVFSFNERLGPVDASTGYLEELVIKGDKTEPDYGGGLCQVSSTFFRAGLFGGLDIVERKAHSYAVSYYARPGGHGLDCTIYPGVSDCKIRNDSPGDLLIQAYTEGNDAYFKFYGTQDGRTVALDGPYYSNQAAAPPDKIIYDPNFPEGYIEEKEQPHNGFDALWYRTVVNAAGVETKRTFISKYQARPKVLLRGGSTPDLTAKLQ